MTIGVANGDAREMRSLPDEVRLHDYFNLAALAVLNTINIWCLVTGKGFYTFWVLTMIYFLLDFLFIAVVPSCVKSPKVLLCHHVISAVYILIPYNYPEHQWCMSYCMLVEINTWFLIAKRNVQSALLEACFYVTWFGLRNILYPWLIYAFYKEWQLETAQCGTMWNPILITPIFQALLTGLNFQWTYALLSKRSKDGQSKQL